MRVVVKEETLEAGLLGSREDALEIGLVDELGGVDVALELAREALDLEADDPVRIKRFPRPRSSWELLFGGHGDRAALATLTRSLAEVQPKVRMLKRLGILSDSGPLTTSTCWSTYGCARYSMACDSPDGSRSSGVISL